LAYSLTPAGPIARGFLGKSQTGAAGGTRKKPLAVRPKFHRYPLLHPDRKNNLACRNKPEGEKSLMLFAKYKERGDCDSLSVLLVIWWNIEGILR